ncbi:MAG: hypothetical protein ACYDD5_00695 [Sulfuricurvum sp.]
MGFFSKIFRETVRVFKDAADILITVAIPAILGPVATYFLYQESSDFKDFYGKSLTNAFAVFGIKDKTVVTVDVIEQKLFDQSVVASSKLLTKLALDHEITQIDPIKLMNAEVSKTTAQYNQFYNYGKGKFHAKLPTVNIRSTGVPHTVIKPILDKEFITDVGILDAETRVPTDEEWVKYNLHKTIGYNAYSNTMIYNTFVYTLTTYVLSGSVYNCTFTSAGNPDVLLTTPIKPTVATVIVDYYIGTSTQFNYWVYTFNTGHPELDTIDFLSSDKFLPIVELRSNSIDIDVDKESDKYKTTVGILNTIGLDTDAMLESIKTNPDIAQLKDAYISFNVDMVEDNPIIAKMLYNWFGDQYTTEDPPIGEAGYLITIKENTFNKAIAFTNLVRYDRVGKIGKVGTYTNSAAGANLVLKKQISEDKYTEYQVLNLAVTTIVNVSETVVNVNTSTLQSTDGSCTMPLSLDMIYDLTPMERVDLFAIALKLSVYAGSIANIRFYQTKEFMNLIQIVIVVISIVLAVLSFKAGGTAGKAFYAFAKTALLTTAAIMTIKEILLQINAPWAKALLIIVAVVIAVKSGYFDSNLLQLGFTTADLVTTSITQYVEAGFEELGAAAAIFTSKMKEANDDLATAAERVSSYLSASEVAQLANYETYKPYLDDVDARMYKAIGMQSDHVHIAVRKPYEDTFDYSRYFRLGV